MSAREVAEAAEAAGSWGEAAAAWRGLAEALAASGRASDAAEAASRGADAFRRDDRPVASARMIRFALERRPATVRDGVLLAGALLDAGEAHAAVQIAAAAADGAADESSRALALDVLVGGLLTVGRVDLARQPLEELAEAEAASARMAARFRQAQVARLDGDLRQAEAQWRALAAQLRPHAAAAAALAATWMELGETALLRLALRGVPWAGAVDDEALDTAEAEACFAAASAAWARVGRRAGYLRSEAWRERLRGEGLFGTIETGLAYADERGLAGMAVEMRLLRAQAHRRPLDALHAVELARETPLVRGRARVIAAELGGPLRADLALAELAFDLPWRARAAHVAARADA
jgi:hypothetical protein